MKRKKLTNGRKPAFRALPPLAEACAAFSGFKDGENRTERMIDILTVVIQRCRRATPQAFYTMREVAAFFKVSLKTIAKIYRRLAREGTLTLVRSSRTMIPPRSFRPRFAIRGVVGMPIWLPGFLQFLDWRRLFSQLEEEFSRHRFVLEPIFYKDGEETEPAFVDRVLKFNPDYILWNAPDVADRQTLLSMGDAGVPLLVINTSLHEFPGRIYRHRYDHGLRKGLLEWEASGEVDRILVPQLRGGEVSATYAIEPALKDCPLPHRFDSYNPSALSAEDYLKRLKPTPRTGIIFDDDILYAHLCIQQPLAMFNLFRRFRVMVMRQVIAPSWPLPTDGVLVDAILPNKRLVRQIATDLSKGQGALPSEGSIFEREWRPRMPLAEAVQCHFGE